MRNPTFAEESIKYLFKREIFKLLTVKSLTVKLATVSKNFAQFGGADADRRQAQEFES
jgi:fructoselysine-6-P-deglycase FrlB-like protein